MDQNNRPVPDDILRNMEVPSSDSIQFHRVKSYTSNSTDQMSQLKLNKMPVYFQFDQLDSNFLYLYTVMNTRELPTDLKPYLPLLLELLLESPVLDKGTLIPHEEVVAQLAEEFLVSETSLGISGRRFVPGPYSDYAVLHLQTEPHKYVKAVDWIKKILIDTQIVADRVKVLATKMENSIAGLKRSMRTVLNSLMNSLLFNESSNMYASGFLRQQSFLKDLLKTLETSPEKVVKRLEEVRSILTRPNNLMVHMAADVGKLSMEQGDLLDVWYNFISADKMQNKPWDFVADVMSLTGAGVSCDQHKMFAGSCESAYLARSVSAISSATDDNLPALLLFLQYLTQCEGPLWRQIRGAGLAYGYNMYPSVSKGQLYLTLHQATHPWKAYKEAKNIVMSYVNGAEPFDPTLLEAAKSSLIFELIEKEKSVGEVVTESLLSSFKGVEREFNRRFLQRVNEVQIDDLKRVASQYIPSLFEADKARTAVVCSLNKLDQVKNEFSSLGINLTVMESLDLTCNNDA